MIKVLTVFGTRPEAIKMCPLILELNENKDIDCKICLTGQHKEMLFQVMNSFELKEDYNLDVMRPNQSLTTITSDVLIKLEDVLEKEKPNLVLVHGDTTTSMAAALAAFYKQIPVGHVEAGLRTGDIYSPFPEEMNRNIISKIATYHFAPTNGNKNNLANEGITENVFVTGNTVIDAFKTTIRESYIYDNASLRKIDLSKKCILVTAHRRENLGEPLENICRAIAKIVETHRDVQVIYPVHLNPKIRECVFNNLGNKDRIYLVEPLDVFDMHNLMSCCYMVMTDSGGLQEEAPALGKPVLVMRKETERPEAVEAGTVEVVGVEQMEIFRAANELLKDEEKYNRMAHAVNPYGDGHASERIVEIISSVGII